MKIKKILNNNVVIAVNRSGTEIIGVGKGVGFQKKCGDIIADDRFEKIFTLTDSVQYQKYSKLMQESDPAAVEIAEQVISYVSVKHPELHLSDIIHISLADHINGVVERVKLGIVLSNVIWPEIQRAYPDEFSVGMYAVSLMQERFHTDLGEDEAAFVAVHIVNANTSKNAANAQKVARIVKDVTVLAESYFDVRFDTTTVDYYRFIGHVKSMAFCILTNSEAEENDANILAYTKSKYPNIGKCAEKIANMILLKYRYHISSEDQAYLILYIERMLRNWNGA